MKISTSPASDAPASPCCRQCCLDDQDQCLGCGRLLSEILEWGAASNSRKQVICENAAHRQQERKDVKPL